MCTIRELSNSIREVLNWIGEFSNWIRELSNSIKELSNSIKELSYSIIKRSNSRALYSYDTFFHIAGVLAILENAANELVRSLIVRI